MASGGEGGHHMGGEGHGSLTALGSSYFANSDNFTETYTPGDPTAIKAASAALNTISNVDLGSMKRITISRDEADMESTVEFTVVGTGNDWSSQNNFDPQTGQKHIMKTGLNSKPLRVLRKQMVHLSTYRLEQQIHGANHKSLKLNIRVQILMMFLCTTIILNLNLCGVIVFL